MSTETPTVNQNNQLNPLQRLRNTGESLAVNLLGIGWHGFMTTGPGQNSPNTLIASAVAIGLRAADSFSENQERNKSKVRFLADLSAPISLQILEQIKINMQNYNIDPVQAFELLRYDQMFMLPIGILALAVTAGKLVYRFGPAVRNGIRSANERLAPVIQSSLTSAKENLGEVKSRKSKRQRPDKSNGKH